MLQIMKYGTGAFSYLSIVDNSDAFEFLGENVKSQRPKILFKESLKKYQYISRLIRNQ